MSVQKQKLFGKDGFDSYYCSLFGERWQGLKASLLKENTYAAVKVQDKETYYMDPASVCAALTLPSGEENLDLCAAPGGKTLVLALCMSDMANLYSNERSQQRKKRLDSVVQNSLPEQISSRVFTSCSDGALWCKKETKKFDSILLDAPCSSERHVLTDSKYLSEWSPSRVKSVSMEQWALLSSAWRLLREGGYLLYATCALNPTENEEQIKRLQKKFADAEVFGLEKMKDSFMQNLKKASSFISLQNSDIESLESLYTLSEPLENGVHLLPDSEKNTGPLYFCLVRKRVS